MYSPVLYRTEWAVSVCDCVCLTVLQLWVSCISLWLCVFDCVLQLWVSCISLWLCVFDCMLRLWVSCISLWLCVFDCASAVSELCQCVTLCVWLCASAVSELCQCVTLCVWLCFSCEWAVSVCDSVCLILCFSCDRLVDEQIGWVESLAKMLQLLCNIYVALMCLVYIRSIDMRNLSQMPDAEPPLRQKPCCHLLLCSLIHRIAMVAFTILSYTVTFLKIHLAMCLCTVSTYFVRVISPEQTSMCT